ncbi:hypothetical protein [Thalassospira xiamenensis]|nr:hypothetical protein [Thalassospira xiamenensis]
MPGPPTGRSECALWHDQIITSALDAPTLRRNHAVQALNYWKVNDL